MRLYHSRIFHTTHLLSLISVVFLFAGCASPQATQELIPVTIQADGQDWEILLNGGSTVQRALDEAGLTIGPLDKTEPPVYAILTKGATVRVIRVSERFEVEQVVIPYTQQTLRNESLGKDVEILIQKGENGLQEITNRRVYEDGVEVSSHPIPVKSIVVKEAIPEIRMVGVQAPFAPQAIPGKLVYLRDGNVWMIEGTTGTRRAVLTTGDLDGRIFSLSSDGNWLLFTRKSASEEDINELWAADLSVQTTSLTEAVEEQSLVSLGISNVIHFADWVPGSTSKVVFSTVEPREAAPGWQANNDLNVVTFSSTGWTTRWTIILETNSGGVYGWWGTNFAWSPDSENLAFARPGSIGLLNYKDGTLTELLEVLPVFTRGDWAWVPGLSWSPDGRILYTTSHTSPPGALSAEESPLFDLTALPLESRSPLEIVSQTGMFSYPMASSFQTTPDGNTSYQIAFLQAIFPTQSDTSRYRIVVMDRDGSNRRFLYPPEGAVGLEPRRDWGDWSPAPLQDWNEYAIAVIVQGNLFLVNSQTGTAVQVTSDGLTTRVIWN